MKKNIVLKSMILKKKLILKSTILKKKFFQQADFEKKFAHKKSRFGPIYPENAHILRFTCIFKKYGFEENFFFWKTCF